MTKQHFIALADTLKAFMETNAGREMDTESMNCLLSHMANFCASQNPNFMRNRWYDYIGGKCGKNGGKVAA